MKWASMAEQLHTSLRSPCAMLSVGWSGVKLVAIGLWSSGNMFCAVIITLHHLIVQQTNLGGRRKVVEGEDMADPSDLVYIEKRRGPRTKPWGTPVVRVCGVDTDPLHVTW